MRKMFGQMLAIGVFCATAAIPATIHAADKPAEVALPKAEKAQLLDFLKNQNSTGFLVFQDGKILIEQYWPAPAPASAAAIGPATTNPKPGMAIDVPTAAMAARTATTVPPIAPPKPNPSAACDLV